MKFTLPWTVCRVCLRKGQMYSLFEKDGTGLTIAEKLRTVAEIKIIPDKQLPQEICRRCTILLNSAHQFQIQCKKIEFVLQMSVKYKGKLEKGVKQHAVVLTLNNGKIYPMPNDVTVKTKFSVLNAGVLSNETTHVSEKSVQFMKSDPEINETSTNNEKQSQFKETIDKTVKGNMPTDCSNRISTVLNSKKNKQKNNLGATETKLNTNPLEAVELHKPDVDEANSRISKDGLHITENILLGRIAEDAFTEIINVDEDDFSMHEIGTTSPSPHNESSTETKKTFHRQIVGARSKSKLFICEICANQYKSKTGFNLHMRVHRNDRRYKCEICCAKFVQSSKLTAHMRSHTGEKPYECIYCSRKFAKKESKLLHERMHTGEKPYECNVCNKKFSYGSVLARHKVLHTNDEKSFLCGICGKRFRFKYHLAAHLKTASHQWPLKKI